MEKMLILTNNPLVRDRCSDRNVRFIDMSMTDLLKEAGYLIHQGYILLSHPLSGSIKPGETCYKSVLLQIPTNKSVDTMSLALIENAIEVSDRMYAERHKSGSLQKRNSSDKDKIRQDLRLIDWTLIDSALQSADQ